MLYLYLDESGDLGFDFFAKKPSRFFTVTILAIKGVENNRAFFNQSSKENHPSKTLPKIVL